MSVVRPPWRLGTMGEEAESSIPAIVKMAHEAPSTALAAAISLQSLGDKGTEALLTMLDSQEDEVRYAAVKSIVVRGQYYGA